MRMLYNIEEAAIASAKAEEIIFVLTQENKYSLFAFSYYQLKHKTTKEFKHISYQKKKDLLYFFLRCCATISFGKYTLSYDYVD